MPDTDRMRAEFEAALRRDIPAAFCELKWRDTLQSYQDQTEDRLWRIWQAACCAQAKRDADLCTYYGDYFGERICFKECAEAIKKDAGL